MGEEHTGRYTSAWSFLRILYSPPSSDLLLEPTDGPPQRLLCFQTDSLPRLSVNYARGYAHNTKALGMDLESEVRTERDSKCGLTSALFR